jgi:hypothetical protein
MNEGRNGRKIQPASATTRTMPAFAKKLMG